MLHFFKRLDLCWKDFSFFFKEWIFLFFVFSSCSKCCSTLLKELEFPFYSEHCIFVVWPSFSTSWNETSSSSRFLISAFSSYINWQFSLFFFLILAVYSFFLAEVPFAYILGISWIVLALHFVWRSFFCYIYQYNLNSPLNDIDTQQKFFLGTNSCELYFLSIVLTLFRLRETFIMGIENC